MSRPMYLVYILVYILILYYSSLIFGCSYTVYILIFSLYMHIFYHRTRDIKSMKICVYINIYDVWWHLSLNIFQLPSQAQVHVNIATWPCPLKLACETYWVPMQVNVKGFQKMRNPQLPFSDFFPPTWGTMVPQNPSKIKKTSMWKENKWTLSDGSHKSPLWGAVLFFHAGLDFD